MQDLIKRLKALDGPCRECDAEIAYIMMMRPDYAKMKERGFQAVLGCGGAQLFTASVDASLTTVPEGWEWYEGHVSRVGGDYQGQTHILRELARGYILKGFHKLPEIAICIAALRARLSHKGE